MSVQYLINTGAVTTLAASTAKTLIEVSSSANLPPEWITVSCSNMAASGFTVVTFATSSASGTGTTATPRRIGTATGTYDGTAKTNLTVEGTAVTDFWSMAFANPFTYERDFPLGREYLQSTSTIMGIRMNSSVAGAAGTPAYATLVIEV